MTELLTTTQMRAIERAAIESGEVTGLDLMERAGAGVVDAVFEEWPEMRDGAHKAVILCGPGNNGGDGFVVARLLKVAGWVVEVYLYGDAGSLPADALANYQRWGAMGDVHPACGRQDAVAALAGCDLMVDAVFGTGLARAVDDPCLWEWFWLFEDGLDLRDIGTSGAPRTVAVDIPSGLSADNGEVIGGEPEHGLRAPRVELTVTFHGTKQGHVIGEGPALCRQVAVVDIGLGKWADAAEVLS